MSAESKKKNDSFVKTLVVAVTLCLICSLLVSGAAVALKDKQRANKAADIQKSILLAARVIQEGEKADFDALFKEKVEPRIIDIATGEYVEGVDVNSFDQRKQANDPKNNVVLSKEEDIASIKRRAKWAKVYLVKDNGHLKAIVLPIKGYGLFSTLYGFIALEADTRTVAGIKFYEHGETAGLGAEITNPKWTATWKGKKVLNEQYQPVLKLVKTGATNDSEVDALSGASMTSRGVQNLITFWLGEQGFGPFLARIRNEQTGGGNHGV
jgi:Na+-transporting NADH:ubiquinone oxidoreductase subunit C